MVSLRTADGGQHTRDFADDILINCPKCGGRAHVRGGVNLTCTNCGLRHQRENARRFSPSGICFERATILSDWYGALRAVAVAGTACTKCGNRVELVPQLKQPGRKPVKLEGQVEAACGTCGTVQRLDILWVPYVVAANPRDHAFGATLYLVEETAKGTLWAYNSAHAEALLGYISAELRECAVGGEDNRTMFALLPGWVKAAKNRKLVEKALTRFTIYNHRR